nr:MAG TPA: hypothetical protein [Caudoviricetes sp.]
MSKFFVRFGPALSALLWVFQRGAIFFYGRRIYGIGHTI